MNTRQLATGAIRLVAIAGFVRLALPFFAGLGEFVTAGWIFPTDINTVTAIGTLLTVAVVWGLAPTIAAAVLGEGQVPGTFGLDVAQLTLMGFALVGLVISTDGIVNVAQEIVQSYTAVSQTGVGMVPPASPYAGPIVGAAMQTVIGALIFLGRQGFANLVGDARDF